MFPGMSAGGCDFSQDAAIKSISNIGAAKAMQIIAKVKAEKKADTTATTKQTATAKAEGPSLFGGLMPLIIGVAVVGGGIFLITNMPKKPAGPLISFPKPLTTSTSSTSSTSCTSNTSGGVRYPVGQVVTLPNGQRALIQSFGRRKIKA